MVAQSFELKLNRAREHLDALKQAIDAWDPGDSYRIVDEFDTKRGHNVVSGEFLGPMPARFGLLIGDCVQNMRAGLDHLAFALMIAYARGPLPPRMEKDSEFPIFAQRPSTADERKRFDRRIAGIDSRAQAVIEELQPYHRNNPRSDPLWLLHELANHDKHRSYHLTALARLGVTIAGENVRVNWMESFGPYRLLQGRTELLHYSASPRNPDAPMDVKIHQPLAVAFADVPPAPGRHVMHTVRYVLAHIGRHVVEPLRPFL